MVWQRVRGPEAGRGHKRRARKLALGHFRLHLRRVAELLARTAIGNALAGIVRLLSLGSLSKLDLPE